MAEQDNNYYYGGHIGPAEEQAAAEQKKQNQRTADILAATSGAMHASFSNIAATGTDEISTEKFNTIIAVMLFYGFAVNAILCFAFGDSIINLALGHPAAYLLIYFVGVIVGMIICRKTENPVVGFIGYNLIVVPMGIFITPFLQYSGIDTVRYAFCVMGVCMMLMIGLAQVYPKFFLSIGRMLFACLLIGLVGELVMWCLNLATGIFDFIFVGIFLGYIGFDWAVAQNYPKTKTSAIRAAYMIYVDLINLLIRLIRIISKERN
jgi:hypothetical protein